MSYCLRCSNWPDWDVSDAKAKKLKEGAEEADDFDEDFSDEDDISEEELRKFVERKGADMDDTISIASFDVDADSTSIKSEEDDETPRETIKNTRLSRIGSLMRSASEFYGIQKTEKPVVRDLVYFFCFVQNLSMHQNALLDRPLVLRVISSKTKTKRVVLLSDSNVILI